jgi:predicted nucleotidyltransferase component of viral defense system
MKEYLLELVSTKQGFNAKMNTMREYLQAYLLRILHDQGFFRTTAFLGGTVLRFLYQIPRFSEDLDFSRVQLPESPLSQLMKVIQRELTLAGYTVSISYKEAKTVQLAMIRYEKLLYETGLSPLLSQKFSVKLEIDTNPPKGAILQTEIVNRYFPLAFLTYDLASLFAGKINALLSRKYTKGRDFFDLGWYLSRWRELVPNLELLRNGLQQSGYPKEMPTLQNWRHFLYQLVEQVDWEKVQRDVENFLENPSDLAIFSKENLLRLLG